MTTRVKSFWLLLLAAVLLAASAVPTSPAQAYWDYMPGYDEWHDGYWQYHPGECKWVAGHYEQFWVSGYNQWVEGHAEYYYEWDDLYGWVQKWYWVEGHWEWVPGYWSQYWVEGHESCAPGYNTWVEGHWEWHPGYDYWVEDTTAPVVSIGTNPVAPVAGQTVTIQWSASDSGGGVSYVEVWRSDNGTSTVYYEGNNGQTSTTMVAEAGHAYTLTVKAWDKDNNVGEAFTSFTVPLPDTTKPTITLQATPASPAAGTNITVTWTAADAGGLKSVMVQQQDSPGSSKTLYSGTGGGSTHTVTAVAGTQHTFSITAEDKAGNSASLSTSVTVPVLPPADTTPPNTATVTVQDVVTNPTFYVRVEASDNAGGSGIAKYDMEYYEQSVNQWRPWLTGVAPAEGNLYKFSGVSGKTYMFRARAIDRAGNAAPMPDRSQAMTFIDGYEPTAFMTNSPYSNADRPTVTWMGVDDDEANLVYTVWYRVNGGSEKVLVSETRGTQAQLPLSAHGDSYDLKVQARDRAGRLSSVSSWSSMVVDQASPYDSYIVIPYDDTTEIQNTWIDVLYQTTDPLSGVASREVLVSKNGGPYTPWLTGLGNDIGENRYDNVNHGESYRFKLRVADRAGNIAEKETATMNVVLYKLTGSGWGKSFDYYVDPSTTVKEDVDAIHAAATAWNTADSALGISITPAAVGQSNNSVFVGPSNYTRGTTCGFYFTFVGGFNIYAEDKEDQGCGSLENTLIHEFGHALGLGDLPRGAVQVMGYQDPYLSAPTEYDIAGLRALYE